jgi:hypothetical protein
LIVKSLLKKVQESVDRLAALQTRDSDLVNQMDQACVAPREGGWRFDREGWITLPAGKVCRYEVREGTITITRPPREIVGQFTDVDAATNCIADCIARAILAEQRADCRERNQG